MGREVLEIVPDRPSWWVGEWLTGSLNVHLSRPTVVDGFDAELVGIEFAQVQVRKGSGKHRHTTTYRESIPFLQQDLEFETDPAPWLAGGELAAGDYEFRFQTPLPPGIPPSFARHVVGNRAELTYTLVGRLSVPWRFDPKANCEVLVVQPTRPAVLGPGYSSVDPKLGTGGTGLVGVLDQVEIPRGDTLRGSVTVNSTGSVRMRGLKISLVDVSFARAKGYTRPAGSSVLATASVPAERAVFGTPLRFSLPVPEDADPSYAGNLCTINHTVVAEADLAFAFNPRLEMPVTVS